VRTQPPPSSSFPLPLERSPFPRGRLGFQQSLRGPARQQLTPNYRSTTLPSGSRLLSLHMVLGSALAEHVGRVLGRDRLRRLALHDLRYPLPRQTEVGSGLPSVYPRSRCCRRRYARRRCRCEWHRPCETRQQGRYRTTPTTVDRYRDIDRLVRLHATCSSLGSPCFVMGHFQTEIVSSWSWRTVASSTA